MLHRAAEGGGSQCMRPATWPCAHPLAVPRRPAAALQIAVSLATHVEALPAGMVHSVKAS